MNINHHELIPVLSYNSNTGIFTWTTNQGNNKTSGLVAGCLIAGYRYINVYKKRYAAHRLAWFYVYHQWPTDELDHIDRNKDNNAISNLRLASRKLQRQNACGKLISTSQYKGVNWDANRKKWRSHIVIDGTAYFLGRFNTELEAAVRYNEAAIEFFEEQTYLNPVPAA